MNSNPYDWKAEARRKLASVAPQPQDEAIERAFMDQAFSHIESRAGRLLEEPHRLGFEIVEKKAGNTKLVAIFAFRVEEELLYCPVFFLNGQIKGADLLHRHARKKFNPFTPEWVDWILSHSSHTRGHAVARTGQAGRRDDRVFLDRLIQPYRKRASEEGVDLLEGSGFANFSDLLESWRPVKAAGSPLERFLNEEGNAWAHEKIASYMAESADFAAAIERRFNQDPVDWLAANWPDPEPVTKQASQSPSLRLCLDIPTDPLTKQASEQFFKHGYAIEDSRDENSTTQVYETGPEGLESCTNPGLYEVLLSDGSRTRMLVGTQDREMLGDVHSGGFPAAVDDTRDRRNIPRIAYDGGIDFCALTVDGAAKRWCDRDAPMGMSEKSILEMFADDSAPLTKSVEAGKVYVLVDQSGRISEPFKVHAVNHRGDLQVASVARQFYDENPNSMVINPDAERSNLQGNGSVVGKTHRFVELATRNARNYNGWEVVSPEVAPGSITQVTSWALSTRDFKSASINQCPITGLYDLALGGDVVSRGDSRLNTHLKLAYWGMHANTADSLLDRVQPNLPTRFLVATEDLAKAASILPPEQLIFPPGFGPGEMVDNGFDSEFNVPMEVPQHAMVMSDLFRGLPEPSRIGDAWDPALGREGLQENSLPNADLFARSPEDLANAAMQDAIPQVLDHGVIGSLVKTYDASAQIDTYLPKLEEALDCIGRILFLLYWKPADFEQDYGVDDMQNLEHELLAQFQGLGDLTLSLLKKAKRRQESAVTFDSAA